MWTVRTTYLVLAALVLLGGGYAMVSRMMADSAAVSRLSAQGR